MISQRNGVQFKYYLCFDDIIVVREIVRLQDDTKSSKLVSKHTLLAAFKRHVILQALNLL